MRLSSRRSLSWYCFSSRAFSCSLCPTSELQICNKSQQLVLPLELDTHVALCKTMLNTNCCSDKQQLHRDASVPNDDGSLVQRVTGPKVWAKLYLVGAQLSPVLTISKVHVSQSITPSGQWTPWNFRNSSSSHNGTCLNVKYAMQFSSKLIFIEWQYCHSMNIDLI